MMEPAGTSWQTGLTGFYYEDSDSDTYGNALVPQDACSQPVDYVSNYDDCNDANPNVNPDATEVLFNCRGEGMSK